MIKPQEAADLAEIVRLLDEAYAHYFSYEGHCKRDEGYVGLHFNNVHDRRGGDPFGIETVDVYSYVLGPSRMHSFRSTSAALEAVREWHAQEMAYDPNSEEDEDR
ncbi:hypothetical protein [Streptomyces zaomyceticus]|uniref:hypothetical protein n=1 Tax=Streptomyces zaomyceticus TaxID=68286 RepID=UPI0034296FE4